MSEWMRFTGCFIALVGVVSVVLGVLSILHSDTLALLFVAVGIYAVWATKEAWRSL